MSCKEMTPKPSDCSENKTLRVVGVYCLDNGAIVRKMSNGELRCTDLDALEKAQKFELWQAIFKPQSQAIVNIVLITGIVLALAEIVWYVMEKL